MTESSQAESQPRISRRGLLVGGLAASAAALVASSGSALAGEPADGQPLLLGELNSESKETFIDATAAPTGASAFEASVSGLGSVAVLGATTGGIGVQGSDYGAPWNLAGTGVYATSYIGNGLKAEGGRNGVWASGGNEGAGVHAENSGSGLALEVFGPATFSRSGIAIVPAGSDHVTIANVSLAPASLVLATLQELKGAVGQRCSVAAAVPDQAASSIALYLTREVVHATPVAWFVLG